MKLHKVALYLTAASLAAPVVAQDASIATDTKAADSSEQAIVVTGSRIKRDPNDSALPLTVISNEELAREGISSPEQLISYLSTNGSGPDNLASNSDVVTGAQRGTNGLSAANLRGQGSGSTLVLLNGRRVAAHGLSGAAVDVNQIPFAAIERVEVLKDGASAIYGTDAIGGVMNFITKTDYQGIGLSGLVDITSRADSAIYRIGGIAGYGDLDNDGFNIMAAASYRWNTGLRGRDRAFVNGQQPDRGLSIDTRGVPFATVFPINPTSSGANYAPTGTLLGATTTTNSTYLPTLVFPGTTTRADGGVNLLDMPGGAGCETMDGGLPYDDALWNNTGARWACAWDTGRAAMLQQPIETFTYFGRGVARFMDDHEISLEVTGSSATSAKRFSNAQVSSNNTTTQAFYPLNALTASTYNYVYNTLLAQFPAIAANYGKPIGFRWRCIECGPREYKTDSETFRAALGIEGPISDSWDYRAGASYAESETSSVLGTGYYYRDTVNGVPGLIPLLSTGVLNPFLRPGEAQTPAALAALAAASAEGETLYGGRYKVLQLDYSVSGSLFELPGGTVQAALGIDYRRETYEFNGSAAAAATAPVIFLAAFDNVNALTPKHRDIKAAYAEILFPIVDTLEVTTAVRLDDYSDFGSTVNPKISAKFRPADWLMFRGSYNTGFRAPAFNQIYNGATISPYSGSDLVDPVRCPSLTPSSTASSPCFRIRPDIITRGNRDLQPETSEQMSLGVVFEPSANFSASVDWWKIDINDNIQLPTLLQIVRYSADLGDLIIRDASNNITFLDQAWQNMGARRTQGLEVTLRAGVDALGGRVAAGMDGTYLLKKKEKVTASAPYQDQIGIFTFTGDLGIRWKHNAFLSWSNDEWNVSLSQIFRLGYKNGALPGIANGTVTRPGYNKRVSDYVTYNLSAGWNATEKMRLTLGIKNIFDTDPPFAITYDGNTGAGGSWEPRVADPRGRSFTIAAEVNF
ncbi:TonB-dependent receptor [Sphingorhabdus pulchriflava]|uniref:TonB-dependent receptor n=1 Tax=Sphingorhabdus pulchriflava TaxID=2292257 RepID=A0A371B5N0_9SPHN|nr:TonB-dependent receptor [Sphingorhabdus pulchriflava]RDV02889.1 TonB-dependent receptor [Sphingorhabdus pulchriflava]